MVVDFAARRKPHISLSAFAFAERISPIAGADPEPGRFFKMAA
jgi:hypothetical protein